MPDSPEIKIADLRAAVDRILAAVEDRLGPEVALEADHYWHLPVDSAFDLTRKPAGLTVGQLSDDLEMLHDGRDTDPASSWHDLAHLIGVLRALERAARQ